MPKEFLETKEWEALLLDGRAFLDVRSEVESARADIPGSINLPILKTEERVLVGTCYVKEGTDAAIRLGHTLVDEQVRAERVQYWIRALDTDAIAAVYCWRGGLRSKMAQEWLAEAGRNIPRVRGGYKAMRNHLLRELESVCQRIEFVIVGGHTGSGKTRLLRELAEFENVLDLEGLACHRGSAFGKVYGEQPAQATFENVLIVELLQKARLGAKRVYLESESRRIGRLSIPDSLYFKMNTAPVVVLEASLEERVEHLLGDYVQFLTNKFEGESTQPLADLKDFLSNAVVSNTQRLGNKNTREILQLIDDAVRVQGMSGRLESHQMWIKRVLVEYYDPFYERHLQSVAERVLLRGTGVQLLTTLCNRGHTISAA